MFFKLERLIDNVRHCQPLDRGEKISGFALIFNQSGRKIFGFPVKFSVDIGKQGTGTQDSFTACLV